MIAPLAFRSRPFLISSGTCLFCRDVLSTITQTISDDATARWEECSRNRIPKV